MTEYNDSRYIEITTRDLPNLLQEYLEMEGNTKEQLKTDIDDMLEEIDSE